MSYTVYPYRFNDRHVNSSPARRRYSSRSGARRNLDSHAPSRWIPATAPYPRSYQAQGGRVVPSWSYFVSRVLASFACWRPRPRSRRSGLGARTIVMLSPPLTPNGQGLAHIGIPVDKIMLLQPTSTADALWAAEQILKAGTCGALLMWQQYVRAENLRRLQLAAKHGDTLFVLFRPLAAAADRSPAELRLALRPTENGCSVEILKRKGPTMSEPIALELKPSPILVSPHRRVTRPVPAIPRTNAIPTTE